ncbi:MAG: hypothetical protein MJZ14_03030 [Paludibacteraceae bacterium]|nr:hypothetical protein [Paludibacteraceae bacterium]
MDTNLIPTNETNNNSKNGKNGNFSIKALFNRPGGTFAKITAVALACGLGFGFVKLLPTLIAIAGNTLFFMGECVCITAIIAVLTSKQFWKWVSLFWYQLNRKIVGTFVKIDPISILEQSIAKMKDKLNNVHENITNLKAILIKMKRKLSEYEEQQADNISKLNIQNSRLKIGGVSSNEQLRLEMSVGTISNDIARLDQIIESQKQRIATSERYQEVMERLEIVAKAKIERSTLDLKRTKDAYEAAEAQKSALKSISSILSGDAQSLEEEMAIEYITNTIDMSVAEMERFLDDSNGVLENINLETAVNVDKVNKIIKKYGGKESFSSFSESAIDVPYEEMKPESITQPEAEKVTMERNKWC